MGKILLSLIWASAIIIVAMISTSNGLSDGASFGIIAGLSGAAWGALHSELGCNRRCLS